jgi:predicted nucleotidyltransferase
MKRDEIISSLYRFKSLKHATYNIIQIGIFGSAARDSMSEHSDIDVVVKLGEQDLFHLIGIKQDLEEEFCKKVDVVSYRDKMNQFLKKKIDIEAVYV